MAADIVKFDVGWKRIHDEGIQPFIDRIENAQLTDTPFPAKHYVKLYDLVFSMAIQRDPFNHSKALYDGYVSTSQNYLKQKVITALHAARATNDLTLLREWIRRFHNQSDIVMGLSKVFTYLDRYYTPAHMEDSPPLKIKGWALFRNLVFDEFRVSAREAILKLIQSEREGEIVDRDMLKSAIGVFIEMGYRNHPDSVTAINVYRNEFERLLIEQSSEFYRSRARLWLQERTCPDYLKEAEVLLDAELGRVQAYLHNTSKDPLINTAVRELLASVQEELLSKSSGTEAMLSNNQNDDLARLYSLFSRVPNGLDSIAAKMKLHIQTLGADIVEKHKQLSAREDKPPAPAPASSSSSAAASGAPAPPADNHQFVKNLMSLHDQYRTVVKTCFKDSQIFQKALKEAFEAFINAEATVSKLLAKFADEVLKKGTKFDQSELERTMDNIVMLYGYIREKDIFERDYQTHLAKRLLDRLSESEQSERSMISKLKSECGYQWTTKLENMFKDVQTSRETCQNFKSKFESDFSLELDVNVCTSNNWPMAPVPDCQIPSALQPVCSRFKDFYLNLFSGRRLQWRMDQGSAELKVRFNAETTRDLVISSYQMCIMILFNSKPVWTYAEIVAITGIPQEFLDTHLLSLAHPKCKVLLKNPSRSTIEDKDTFEINDAFTNRLFRVKVPLMKTTSQAQKEDKDRDEEISKQRSHQVDAAVVRIMKTRKTLSHNVLVTEVVNQLSSRFNPQIPLIRKRIESLIEQEYLARDEKDRSIYNYLA